MGANYLPWNPLPVVGSANSGPERERERERNLQTDGGFFFSQGGHSNLFGNVRGGFFFFFW